VSPSRVTRLTTTTKQKEDVKMKKSFIGLLIFAIIGLWRVTPTFATSTSVDALVNKLVEKGFLTEKEAAALELEIAAEEKMVREDSLKQGLPSWVHNTKLKGDFRLRYQYERKETDADARLRGRIRYRLGLESKVNDQINVGLGIAGGADDPRSTNQTFTDTFEHPDVRMDLAYMEYAPLASLKLVGGIFPRSKYLWAPTDLLWDGDINPQGGSARWEKKFNDQVTPYFNTGVWVLDEISSTTSDRVDPFLHYAQGGIKFKEGDWSANVAGTYYGFNGLKGTCPDWSSGTNTGITASSCAGSLRYDYDSAGASAELALATPFEIEAVPEVGVFGDFIRNIDGNVVDNNAGWALGAKIGDKKVVSTGQWQFKYIFASLGKDAFVDFTPDSDRYGGRTDTRSHEGILEYGLSKNVSLGLDYYQSKRVKATENPEHLIQADINMKF
jgi:hypothetical protein